MVADQHYNHLGRVRAYLAFALSPLQYTVDAPLNLIEKMRSSIVSHQTLQKENAQLRVEHIFLRAQVQKFTDLKKENERLRALLQSSDRLKENVAVARLLAVNTDPYVQQLVLAAGTRQGVYVGQAVLDPEGVLGQVISVSLVTSQVILLTDARSAIPIEDSRNGVRAIAIGQGSSDELLLRNVPKTTTIQVGDRLVTSGLGQRFPAGYPVGIVTKVARDPGERFAHITIKPQSRVNRSRLVLLVWPDTQTLSKGKTHDTKKIV